MSRKAIYNVSFLDTQFYKEKVHYPMIENTGVSTITEM